MAILGIDEVGRGPLAGPLVMGAVILPEKWPEWVNELKDSKKLTARKRAELSNIIMNEVPAVGLGWVSPVEIDELGMMGALRLATRRAVEEVQRVPEAHFSEIIIDGNINFLSGTALAPYTSTVIKGDDKIKQISAASIVAKHARDTYMCEIAVHFPEYGFEKHMGYGTKRHREAIMKFGPTEEHRKSFEPVKSLIGFERKTDARKNTTRIGGQGETATAEYLVRHGHEIVARNFKTYFYEIDIISVKGDTIYFTEVKTRKSNMHGGGLAAVDAKKLGRMKFAAESFMKYAKSKYGHLSPMLAVACVNGKYEVETWFPIH
ncbi:ribonuclease HII [Candidatus Saccharibacteria bacterium]|nr:ribonuclease HII [Candidatus Saccharibacteria bacterium]